jgi:hypothetical protein
MTMVRGSAPILATAKSSSREDLAWKRKGNVAVPNVCSGPFTVGGSFSRSAWGSVLRDTFDLGGLVSA